MLQSNTLFRYLEPAAGGVSLNVSTWGQDSKVTFIQSCWRIEGSKDRDDD
jgi:hypothetical protein